MITHINNAANKAVSMGIAICFVYLAAWTGWIEDPRTLVSD